jgi:hypothetical protein
VVIPPKLKSAVLIELHEGHPGITQMKSLVPLDEIDLHGVNVIVK